MKLSMTQLQHIPAAKFGIPSRKAFPMTDPNHQRMAISGATRSFHAGNISGAQEAAIKAKARALLAR